MGDISQTLRQQVEEAAHSRTALRLTGRNSKAFLGNPVEGEALQLAAHAGVVSYEPTELVLTARGGTPLQEIEQLLDAHAQQLPFEPPCFGGAATLGGAVASGLAGPARPWSGAPRDALLGVRLLDGRGRLLRFGGQVMKNVAGYDVSRLMAGAHGTLGALLELSLKVLPKPAENRTLVLEVERNEAIARMRELCRRPVPLRGACHHAGRLYLRLSGSRASVRAWQQQIGGELLAEHNTFWQRLRDQQLDFFDRPTTLWRLSLKADVPSLACEQDSLVDWAGAQRWVYSAHTAEQIRGEVAALGGHAEVFRRGPGETAAFQELSGPLLQLHRSLKQRFDPHGILNPGRLFDEAH